MLIVGPRVPHPPPGVRVALREHMPTIEVEVHEEPGRPRSIDGHSTRRGDKHIFATLAVVGRRPDRGRIVAVA